MLGQLHPQSFSEQKTTDKIGGSQGDGSLASNFWGSFFSGQTHLAVSFLGELFAPFRFFELNETGSLKFVCLRKGVHKKFLGSFLAPKITPKVWVGVVICYHLGMLIPRYNLHHRSDMTFSGIRPKTMICHDWVLGGVSNHRLKLVEFDLISTHCHGYLERFFGKEWQLRIPLNCSPMK